MAEDKQPERVGPTGRARPRPGRRRGLWPVVAAVALLALVAVGSLRGPLGSGRGRARYPADLIDSLLVLLFLAMLAGGVLAVVALWSDQRLGAQRRRGGTLGLLLPMAAGVLLWLFRGLLGLGAGRNDPSPDTPTAPTTIELPTPTPDPGVLPLVVAGVALAAMVAIVVSQLVADRRRRGPPRSPAEQLVELLDDTLEDLEGEPDPRRAVIAAWARMERGLAAAGLPRHPAEAPFEYAARVLETALAPTDRTPPAGPLRPGSVHRLTGLFERAKFSRHTIGEEDRGEAIAALRAVRRELAEAAEADALAEAEAARERASRPLAGGGGR